MKQLSLSYFGAFQAAVNGQPLTNFRSAKIQGLLIYLTLTAQQAHSRDELAALFWPDESESAAKQNLPRFTLSTASIAGGCFGG